MVLVNYETLYIEIENYKEKQINYIKRGRGTGAKSNKNARETNAPRAS